MISCKALVAQLGDYLEGDLVADVRREMENYLSNCRTCQALYDSTRKMLEIVTKSGCFDLPETSAKRIAENVVRRIRTKLRPSRP